jgi:hypothetical protein
MKTTSLAQIKARASSFSVGDRVTVKVPGTATLRGVVSFVRGCEIFFVPNRQKHETCANAAYVSRDARKPFVSSARLGARLSTSAAALDARVNAAFDKHPALRGLSFSYGKGGRDSETLVNLDNGVAILVSYETVVAFRLHGSANVAAVALGHHSRTTDRSIRDFALKGALVELTPSAFLEAVADASTL